MWRARHLLVDDVKRPLSRTLASLCEDDPMHVVALRYVVRFWYAASPPLRGVKFVEAMAWAAKVYDICDSRSVPPPLARALENDPASIPAVMRSLGIDTSDPWSPENNTTFDGVFARVVNSGMPHVPVVCVSSVVDVNAELRQWFDTYEKLGLPALSPDIPRNESTRMVLIGEPLWDRTGTSAPEYEVDVSAFPPEDAAWRSHMVRLGGRLDAPVTRYLKLCRVNRVCPVYGVLRAKYAAKDAIAKELVMRVLLPFCSIPEDTALVREWVDSEFWKAKGCAAYRMIASGDAGFEDLYSAPLETFLARLRRDGLSHPVRDPVIRDGNASMVSRKTMMT